VSCELQAQGKNPTITDLSGILCPSQTQLSASSVQLVAGQTTTLTATVEAKTANPYDTVAPYGSVSFFNGTTLLGTAPIGNGKAAIAAEFPAPGVYRITATFNGNDGEGTHILAGSTTLVPVTLRVAG
jgi:hypothetical protein